MAPTGAPEVMVCSCGLSMKEYDSTGLWFCLNCDRLQPQETEPNGEDNEGNVKYYPRWPTVQDLNYEAQSKRNMKRWYQGGGV